MFASVESLIMGTHIGVKNVAGGRQYKKQALTNH